MHFENYARKNGLFRDVPDELWNDWHWQVKNRVETLEDLKKYLNLTEEEEEGVRRTLGRLRMAITPYYLSLTPRPMSWNRPPTRRPTPSTRTRIPP